MFFFKKKKQIEIDFTPMPGGHYGQFEVNVPLIEEGIGQLQVLREEVAKGHPELDAFFKLTSSLEQLLIRPHKITVSMKEEVLDWREFTKNFAQLIRESLAEREFLAFEKKEQEKVQAGDDLGERVQRVLTEKINPSVASHGGEIVLVKCEDAKAYITMKGGCQGCSMASQTLRQGVEKTLCDEIPELIEVVDLTNHGAGENPYS